jgi:acyl-CoA thioesterase FadM
VVTVARTVSFEIPADSSLFNPLQLQPRTAFWFAMTGWARWLREHWVPFPRLIRDHGLGVVIAGFDLEYLRPFAFFDSDAVAARAALRIRPGGRLLIFSVRLAPCEGGADVARVTAVLRPVRIGDGLVLSATPTNLDPETVERFAEDEMTEGPQPRLSTVVEEIEDGRSPVAVGSRTFTLHRHLCETADQWSALALPDVMTEARESLIATAGDEAPALSAGLVEPMSRLWMEFQRPVFFLDDFAAECSAYTHDGRVVFLHRFRSPADGQPHATLVEWFPNGKGAST